MDISYNVLMAFAILGAKIVEQTLASVKLILMMRQKKFWAMLLAFCECLVWALVISGILTTLKTNIWWVLAYCTGYAVGYLIGMKKVVKLLKDFNCGLTIIDGHGAKATVRIIITVVPKKISKKIIEAVNNASEDVIFTTTSDVSRISGGCGIIK